MVFLEFRPEALSSPRVVMATLGTSSVASGNPSGFLSSRYRGMGHHLELRRGNSGLFSSCNSDLGFPFLEFHQEPGINSC